MIIDDRMLQAVREKYGQDTQVSLAHEEEPGVFDMIVTNDTWKPAWAWLPVRCVVELDDSITVRQGILYFC